MNIITTSGDIAATKEDIPGKVIRNLGVARMIKRRGGSEVEILDVKPDKFNKQRTVVVFRNDDKFNKIFSDVLDEIGNSRASNDYKKHEDIDELREEIKMLKRMIAERE